MRITITHDEDISADTALKYARDAETERAAIAKDHKQILLTYRYTDIVCSSHLKKNGNISAHVWREKRND